MFGLQTEYGNYETTEYRRLKVATNETLFQTIGRSPLNTGHMLIADQAPNSNLEAIICVCVQLLTERTLLKILCQ